MAKNYTAPAGQKAAAKAVVSQDNKLSLKGFMALLAPALFLVVHFLGDFGAYDAMGAQWTYLVILNFLLIIYLIARKDDYNLAATKIFGNIFSRLYLAFFALAGISIVAAINPTESIVCYVRLIATVVGFFNVAILLYGQLHFFRALAQIIALILFVESFQTIRQFVQNENSLKFSELIMGLKGSTGNKNIFAAGLVTKVPFALYCMYRMKLPWKILNAIIVFIAAWAVVLVSARASYLSLLVVLLMFIVFVVMEYRKEKQLDQALFLSGSVIVAVVGAFFIANMQLTDVKMTAAQEEAEVQVYGAATDRLALILETGDESNQVRFRLWAHAADYTKKHPIMGCGVGNWKIASIPYQRTITNDLFVPIHAHNDYVEQFAELGIPGGLLYLSLFLFITLFTIRTYFSDAEKDTKLISVFSYIAFVTYMTDAFFNFPMERPISQVFFLLIAAVNVNAFIKGREEQKDEKILAVKPNNAKIIFAFVAALLLVPSAYVTYQTYKSLILQRTVLGDLNNEPLRLDWKVIIRDFPSIPNLSATAQPIEAIKGRYLYEAGKFDEALVLLDKGTKANPVIGYSEFLKAGLYFKKALSDTANAKKWLDSASRNGLYAFNVRPKAKTYYQTLVAVLAKKRDTTGIKKAFLEFDLYRHTAYAHDMFLQGMINAYVNMGKMPARMIHLADSALSIFSQDSSLKVRKTEIVNNYNLLNRSPGSSVAAINEASRNYASAVGAFTSGQTEKAAQLFLKAAELNPGYIAAIENAAICYFNLRKYDRAIALFDRELATKLSIDGKPEYYKAIALMNTGRNEEGCATMRLAAGKKYLPIPNNDPTKTPEGIMKTNCK